MMFDYIRFNSGGQPIRHAEALLEAVANGGGGNIAGRQGQEGDGGAGRGWNFHMVSYPLVQVYYVLFGNSREEGKRGGFSELNARSGKHNEIGLGEQLVGGFPRGKIQKGVEADQEKQFPFNLVFERIESINRVARLGGGGFDIRDLKVGKWLCGQFDHG